jgi:hypothetical protein
VCKATTCFASFTIVTFDNDTQDNNNNECSSFLEGASYKKDKTVIKVKDSVLKQSAGSRVKAAVKAEVDSERSGKVKAVIEAETSVLEIKAVIKVETSVLEVNAAVEVKVEAAIKVKTAVKVKVSVIKVKTAIT